MWCDCFASIGHFSFDLLQLLIDNLDSDVINRHKTTKWALWIEMWNGWESLFVCVCVQFAKWFLPFQMPYRYWLLIVALLLCSVHMKHEHRNYLLVQPNIDRTIKHNSERGKPNERVEDKENNKSMVLNLDLRCDFIWQRNIQSIFTIASKLIGLIRLISSYIYVSYILIR